MDITKDKKNTILINHDIAIGKHQIQTHTLKDCIDIVMSQTLKETKQLQDIIEKDKGIIITRLPSHNIITTKVNKKPFWKKGKLKYK